MSEETDDAKKRQRSPSLLNRSLCRRFLLDSAAKTRSHKFTRVSPEVFEALEFKMRDWMRDIVRSLPSKGKTIQV